MATMTLVSSTTTKATAPRSTGLLAFSLISCGSTWCLAVPAATAWIHHQPPGPYAVACAGLSAFGPLLAAVVVGGRQRALRDIFGRWRVTPGSLVLALAVPLLVHTLARVLYAGVGGHPACWLEGPRAPEDLAALVVFPLGEEFGWRGFAHPRLTKKLGAVRGPLALGALWGLWHLAYAVTPAAASFDVTSFATTLVELPLYALIIAWLFERADRSMAVALAVHAGAHLDNLDRAQRADLRLLACHLAVAAAVAGVAAWSLAKGAGRSRAASAP